MLAGVCMAHAWTEEVVDYEEATVEVGGCKTDAQEAFLSALRDKVLEKVLKHSPDLYPLVYNLYKGSSKHTVEGEPGAPLETVVQGHGFDQARNMSMGGFCITTRDALHDTQVKMREHAS